MANYHIDRSFYIGRASNTQFSKFCESCLKISIFIFDFSLYFNIWRSKWINNWCIVN